MKFDLLKSEPNYLIDLSEIKTKDIVKMKTIYDESISRYLVLHISKSKEYLDVLSLESFYSKDYDVEVPILSVPFCIIAGLEREDKTSLLFLANHHNPHIIKALEEL
tara:strand:+ start:279 stop:599 length:321 start_codon:yes stop_codon:yes gene_type:complete